MTLLTGTDLVEAPTPLDAARNTPENKLTILLENHKRILASINEDIVKRVAKRETDLTACMRGFGAQIENHERMIDETQKALNGLVLAKNQLHAEKIARMEEINKDYDDDVAILRRVQTAENNFVDDLTRKG